MTNTLVTRAIETSIRETRIVTIPRDVRMGDNAQGIAADLAALCDDSVENGDVIEYWGTDDDGDEWRVHLGAL